ncbi:hypothetical protein H920_05796 [Fukomys damarensis]|uniref:Uncharacterized protein n=1 Tax=Fukomys damarensis TaxID=885580 RepID=A0A091DKZ0_FUKDA|nr:hypothetical protein H920_05796 [Fukomys damarensis]
MRHSRKRTERLDRRVDEKTGSRKAELDDDAAKKGKRSRNVPITTNNRRNDSESQMQNEKLKAHSEYFREFFLQTSQS